MFKMQVVFQHIMQLTAGGGWGGWGGEADWHTLQLFHSGAFGGSAPTPSQTHTRARWFFYCLDIVVHTVRVCGGGGADLHK